VQANPKSQCPSFGQLTNKDNAVDLVDEGTTPPQKPVLRTVRAENTELAGVPLCFSCLFVAPIQQDLFTIAKQKEDVG